jgi:hypothetical protein
VRRFEQQGNDVGAMATCRLDSGQEIIVVASVQSAGDVRLFDAVTGELIRFMR